jgi:hypothetical protein
MRARNILQERQHLLFLKSNHHEEQGSKRQAGKGSFRLCHSTECHVSGTRLLVVRYRSAIHVAYLDPMRRL